MSAAPPLDTCSEMFGPPANRLMKVLDRSFFRKSIPLAAAQVKDIRRIASLLRELQTDVLDTRPYTLHNICLVQPAPKGNGLKALLLKPDIKVDGTIPCPRIVYC